MLYTKGMYNSNQLSLKKRPPRVDVKVNKEKNGWF